MIVRADWPKVEKEPYEITTTTESGSTKAGPVDSDSEFSRFEALTSKLVQAPKSELDEKREQS